MMMMMMIHMVMMTTARIIRRRNMASIFSLIHAPILFLRASGDLLLLLLRLYRLLSSFPFPVVFMRTPGARRFSPRSVPMAGRRTDLGTVPVRFRTALDVLRASKEVQSEGLPASPTLFLAPGSRIRRRFRVASGGGTVTFLDVDGREEGCCNSFEIS